MPKKILIVEDEPDLLQLTKIRLEKSGYDVRVAINSSAAYDFAKEEAPDLILLDLLLPGERGEQFCKTIRADARLKATPIILFTASACNISDKLKETQADDYILKPFDTEELLGKIKKIIAG